MYKVNLLPHELKSWDKKVDKRRLIIIAVSSFVVGIILISYGAFLFKYLSARWELDSVETELARMKFQADRVQKLMAQREQNEQTVQALKKLIQGKQVWGHLLDDINQNMPVDIWLTSLKITYDQTQGHPVIPGTSGQVSGQNVTGSTQPGSKANNTGQPNSSSPVNNNSQQATRSGQTQPNQNQTNTSANGQVPAGNQQNGNQPPAPPNVIVIAGNSRSAPSVGVFEKNLTKLYYFSSVSLDDLEGNSDGTFKFTITAVLRAGGL